MCMKNFEKIYMDRLCNHLYACKIWAQTNICGRSNKKEKSGMNSHGCHCSFSIHNPLLFMCWFLFFVSHCTKFCLGSKFCMHIDDYMTYPSIFLLEFLLYIWRRMLYSGAPCLLGALDVFSSSYRIYLGWISLAKKKYELSFVRTLSCLVELFSFSFRKQI